MVPYISKKLTPVALLILCWIYHLLLVLSLCDHFSTMPISFLFWKSGLYQIFSMFMILIITSVLVTLDLILS